MVYIEFLHHDKDDVEQRKARYQGNSQSKYYKWTKPDVDPAEVDIRNKFGWGLRPDDRNPTRAVRIGGRIN